MPFPEHSPRTRSPARLLPTEPAGSQLLSLKSLAPEYKVLGTRSLEAWAAAKAEIRGRGGLQWSNFRPPATLGPRGQAGRLGHAGSRWSQAGHQGRRETVDFLLPLRLKAQKHQPAGRVGSGTAGHEGLLRLKRAQVVTQLLRATQPCNSVHGSVTHDHPLPCQAWDPDTKMNTHTLPEHLQPSQGMANPAPSLSLIQPHSRPNVKPEGSAAWCFLRPFHNQLWLGEDLQVGDSVANDLP